MYSQRNEFYLVLTNQWGKNSWFRNRKFVPKITFFSLESLMANVSSKDVFTRKPPIR